MVCACLQVWVAQAVVIELPGPSQNVGARAFRTVVENGVVAVDALSLTDVTRVSSGSWSTAVPVFYRLDPGSRPVTGMWISTGMSRCCGGEQGWQEVQVTR